MPTQPSRTFRPSRKSFQRAGWLPESEEAFLDFMHDLSKRAKNRQQLIRDGDDELLPAVQEFKDFIESEPTVYGEFIRMFEVPVCP